VLDALDGGAERRAHLRRRAGHHDAARGRTALHHGQAGLRGERGDGIHIRCAGAMLGGIFFSRQVPALRQRRAVPMRWKRRVVAHEDGDVDAFVGRRRTEGARVGKGGGHGSGEFDHAKPLMNVS
jgi:hypothetical protein